MTLLKVEKKVIAEVEVELPFHFVHFLDSSVLYGRVDELGCTQVLEQHGNEVGFEVTREKSHPNRWTCYLEPGHKSNGHDFNEALKQAREFINGIEETDV